MIFREGRRRALSSREPWNRGNRTVHGFHGSTAHGSTVQPWNRAAAAGLHGSTAQPWNRAAPAGLHGFTAQPLNRAAPAGLYGHGLPVHGPVRRLPPYSNLKGEYRTSTPMLIMLLACYCNMLH